jgi:hypothetical protein
MSLASLAISRALPQLFLLTIEIISGASYPASFKSETLLTVWRPRVISVSMSAIFFC